jgi:hypothetical protein
MKKILYGLLVSIIALPLVTSAHESRVYEIGEKGYQLVVGSLNEPIAVDDKTGVYIKVTTAELEHEGAMKEEADHHEAVVPAVEGLDKGLKVEISAGGKKKTMDLTPIHGEAGAYRAMFTPTIETTYAYRFFGEINKTPVDLTFTCNPAGHPASPEDKTEVEVSAGVHQVLKKGAFGCPVAKAGLGFPEPSVTNADMAAALMAQQKKLDRVAREFGFTQIALGLLAVTLAVVGFRRKKALVS